MVDLLVMMLIILSIALLIGCIVLFVKSEQKRKNDSIGVLRIYSSDSDEPPYFFLELQEEIEAVRAQKYVIFEVKNGNRK